MALSSQLTAHACQHADVLNLIHSEDKKHFSKNPKLVKVGLLLEHPASRQAFFDPRWPQLPTIRGRALPTTADLAGELLKIWSAFPDLKERRGFNTLASGERREKWVKVKLKPGEKAKPLVRETFSFETFQTDFMRKHFEENDYREMVAAGASGLSEMTGLLVVGSNVHFDTSHDHIDYYAAKYDPETGHRRELHGQRVGDGAAINIRRDWMGLPVPKNFDSQRKRQASRANGDDDLASWNAFVGGLLDEWLLSWAQSHGLATEYEQGRQREAVAIKRRLDLEAGALRVAELVASLEKKDRYIDLLEKDLDMLRAKVAKHGLEPSKLVVQLVQPPEGREQPALGPTKEA